MYVCICPLFPLEQAVRSFYIYLNSLVINFSLVHMQFNRPGNDVVIDVATIRPFTVDEGYFLLLPITIGKLSTHYSYDVIEAALFQSHACTVTICLTYFTFIVVSLLFAVFSALPNLSC